MSAELHDQLRRALAGKDADYRPRTHHLSEDGRPLYTNRLILETSPYLLQHAHNPVNWYPWGEEAFADAKRLGRPILLSIGYSTCHWCHVMEEESFEDVEIASVMNADYIAIKVDREERPDLDAVYMAAVQMLTGRGGWPMTTWLTPDGRPFYGGTYFPARDGDRGQRTGFLTLLRKLKGAYDAQPQVVADKARELTRRIQSSLLTQAEEAVPFETSLRSADGTFRANFDWVHGGRDQSPKFPSNLPIRFLLRRYRTTGDEKLLEMATLTLTKMANGGIYDQVGGGFHRYSTDARWLVPHFEKMLYDNALLTVAYVEAYQLTGREEFARVARDVLSYVAREMTSPDGAFYSATDADSLNPEGEREEGWFFTWTPAELKEVLGEEAAKVQAYYGVSASGNFEGRNILHVTRTVEEVAARLGMPAERLRDDLERAREKLYAARLRRPAPLRDEKILTSWNGLMISAMARAGFAFDDPELLERAGRAATFVLKRMRRDGRLLRSFKDGKARFNAYLDDYAFLTAGLLDLYEGTADPLWLREALGLQATLDEHYWDEKVGGYFATSDDHEALIAREKPAYDGAEPSGNSVALMNLYRLQELTLDDRHRQRAEKVVQGFSGMLRRRPTAVSEMLLALQFKHDRPKEIVIVTAKAFDEAEPLLDVVRRTFAPSKVLAVVSEVQSPESLGGLLPLVKGKVTRKGRATAYVCEQGVCQLPTTEPDAFRRQLERTDPVSAPRGAEG